ncbi:MAG: hypothetical protein JST09_04995 [Bacteroidetes bacterium]|nr:hypothetical protein [Bacteroidota bacterium]MBS1574641.1 hypothetical protein [Bacteroidota bacterium]
MKKIISFPKKISIKHSLYLFFILSAFNISSCKSQTLPGVYAGVGIELQVNFGGGMGMGRNDITLYLRPDGTFTNDLKSKTWRTDVKGNYKQSGNKVILTYNNIDRKDTYTYKNSVLSDGSTILVRMDENDKVPAGKYSFTYATGSGGGMSGSTYIGASGGNEIYFDGKGNFSKEGYGAVVVSGDNIGGGTSHADATKQGTYSLHNNELTLKYKNGEIEKHSFFASNGETVTAIIDGQIYFMDKSDMAKLPTAAALADAIKNKQGGKAIDEMKSLLTECVINGVKIIIKKNFTNNSVRIEFYKDGKIALITQWNGNDGWEWSENKKRPISDKKEKDLRYNFFTGVAALRKSSIDLLAKGSVTKEGNGYCLNYLIDGINFKMITDKDYKIISESNSITGEPFVSRYSNYKTISGILFPFNEEDETGGQAYETVFTRIIVNDPGTLDWKEPGEY